VRGAAHSQMGSLLAILLSGEAEPMMATSSSTSVFVSTICSMASMTSCHTRSNFVHVCSSLVRALDTPFVTQHLLPHLEPLATDHVANVRLPLAELIVAELMPYEHYASLPLVNKMLAQLKDDADRDVRRPPHRFFTDRGAFTGVTRRER